MAEDGLNFPKIDAEFEEMSGEAVAQGMNGDSPVDTAVSNGRLERELDTASIHRAGGLAPELGFSICVWEKEPWITVSHPETAKGIECDLRHGDIAILAAFGIADVRTAPFGIDISDFQPQTFAQSQAHAVDGEEKHAVPEFAGGVEEFQRLFPGENIGQRADAWRLDDFNPIPGSIEHVPVEEADAVTIHFDRAPGM